MSTPEELAWEAEYEMAIEAYEAEIAARRSHLPDCPMFCPGADTEYISPGASLPKCRGGDCTLCDEAEYCACDIIKRTEVRVRAEARRTVASLQEDSPFIRADDAIDALREVSE